MLASGDLLQIYRWGWQITLHL